MLLFKEGIYVKKENFKQKDFAQPLIIILLFATFFYIKFINPDYSTWSYYQMPISNVSLSVYFPSDYQQKVITKEDLLYSGLENKLILYSELENKVKGILLIRKSDDRKVWIIGNIDRPDAMVAGGSTYLKKAGSVKFCNYRAGKYDAWDGRHEERIAKMKFYYLKELKILIYDDIVEPVSQRIIDSICIKKTY